MVRVRAKAKLNLFLEVTRRRADGYHELVTLFARIGVADVLTLRKAGPGIKLLVKGGPPLGAPADNIVYKAAERFFSVFGIPPAVEITLEKRVPVGAGLGGGSSDGAAALMGLARLYRLPRSGFPKLMKIAAAIGSDVAFFLLDSVFAEGRGRGEKLRALEAGGRLPHVVLVYPGRPVYTREVYGSLKVAGPGEVRARLRDFRELCRRIREGTFDPGRAGCLFNRLEDPVLPRHKAVRLARERLLSVGAEAALMSGSGSCVFGLFSRRAAAAAAARALECIRGYNVFLTKFC